MPSTLALVLDAQTCHNELHRVQETSAFSDVCSKNDRRPRQQKSRGFQKLVSFVHLTESWHMQLSYLLNFRNN